MKHDFVSAAAFYEEAIKAQPHRMALRLSLAELYRNMGRAEKALAALQGVYKEAGEAETLEALMLRGRALRIEARVHQRAEPTDPTNYIDALNQARAVQDRLLGRLRGEAADLVRQQRQVAASLCSELAQVAGPGPALLSRVCTH
jgi:tetratricopeptide (TPR) repeat protein